MAGEAVKALTLQVDQTNGTDDSIEQRKKTFAKATSDYFGALSYVDIHLRREIYALEEANIIPADIPKDTGATGNLDIGWLNSRNDKVGTDMRAELWSQAKEILDVINLDEIFKKTNQSNETISE